MAVRTIKPGGGGDFTDLGTWFAFVQGNVGVEDAECYAGTVTAGITIDSSFLPSSSRIYAHSSARHDGYYPFFTGASAPYVQISDIIEVARGDITIDGLVFVEDGFLSLFQFTSATGPFTNVVIQNCNFANAFQIGDPGQTLEFPNLTADIENNLFWVNLNGSLYRDDATSITVNLNLYNNTGVRNFLTITAIKGGAGTVTLNSVHTNNYFRGMSVGDSGTGATVNFTWTDNATQDGTATAHGGTGNLANQDPRNWFQREAYPKANTFPGFNAGATIGSFSTDVVGTARPQSTAWDIGAFEFIDSGGGGGGGNNIIGG